MRFRLVSIAIVLAITVITAAAEELNLKSTGLGSDEPISLDSRKALARNLPDGVEFTFDGNVQLRQGTLTLTCDKLVIVYDEKLSKASNPNGKLPKDLQTVEAIRSMVAVGNVKFVQGERTATAGKAVFDNVKRTLILTDGPPRLWQGADSAVADTIIIYVDENRSELRGGNGNKIKFLINPGKKKKDNQ